MEGEATLVCLGSKQWSQDPPSCNRNVCFSPPRVEHATYANPQAQEAFNIGDRLTYKCDAGYEFLSYSFNPTGTIECLDTGLWQANLPECFIVKCRQPPPIQHGNAVVSSVNLEFGSFVRYICNEGYELLGETTLNCQSDSTWSGTAPSCQAIECVAPPFVLNGWLDYKDLKLGTVIKYRCNVGHELSGFKVRRCLANLTWEGEEPVCSPVNCGEPKSIDNGLVEYEDTIFQAPAEYKCNTGYILGGEKTRLCTEEKRWSGEKPTCEIVQCDKPSHIISNGRMIGEVFTYGSDISYECDTGYYINGLTNNRTCLASGEWNRPIPVCTPVERTSIRNWFNSIPSSSSYVSQQTVGRRNVTAKELELENLHLDNQRKRLEIERIVVETNKFVEETKRIEKETEKIEKEIENIKLKKSIMEIMLARLTISVNALDKFNFDF